jgi:exopolysaccharide biosynthesis polyprenyl glycosylphosphotransferase
MFRRFSTNFAILSIFLDAVMIALALITANIVRPLLNIFPFAADIKKPTIPTPLYPIFIIIWISIFLLLSIYDGRRNLYVVDELTSVTLGTILAGVSLAGLLYISYRDISRLLFLVFVGFTYLSTIIWRLIARLLFRYGSSKPHVRKVLIIGAGPVGKQLQEQIQQRPYLGLSIEGFLDDDPSKRSGSGNILGDLSITRRIVETNHIDDVIIALPRRAHEQVSRLVAELHEFPVKIWVIPDYFHLALHKATVEEFAGLPMLDLRAPALHEYQRLVKRIFDIIIGTIIQILVFPIMILIALAIKIDSSGPIFYKSKRVGENGQLFRMYKFRSMVVDADKRLKDVIQHDEQGNIIHKTPDDPRVTRVGKFIRRTSLDELPQLFNVFKGEMSLVGPRPEIPTLVEQYKPWQRKRFAVPQGITGWWQVNGRSDKPMHLHTEDDIYYVQHYSLLLDIQILVKTAWVVMRGKGAY